MMKFVVPASVLVIAAIAFGYWHFDPAEADARHFAQKYADAKDPMDRCSMADLTDDAYGKVSNREKYDEWMAVRSKECAVAGVTMPQLPYQPAKDRH